MRTSRALPKYTPKRVTVGVTRTTEGMSIDELKGDDQALSWRQRRTVRMVASCLNMFARKVFALSIRLLRLRMGILTNVSLTMSIRLSIIVKCVVKGAGTTPNVPGTKWSKST